jgi:hypothetical protein
MGKHKTIHRFPRRYEDYPSAVPEIQHLPLQQRAKAMLAMGLQPPRWLVLTSKQKKLIKSIVMGGRPVLETLKKFHVHQNSYYSWMNGNIAFREYYAKMVAKAAGTIETRLDGMLGKAVRKVEDAIDSRDPYFSYNAALNHLKGRGKYRTKTDVSKDVQQTVTVQGGVSNSNTNIAKLDSDTMQFFINALIGKAKGIEASVDQPKILDVEILKQLPPPQGTESEIQVSGKKPNS